MININEHRLGNLVRTFQGHKIFKINGIKTYNYDAIFVEENYCAVENFEPIELNKDVICNCNFIKIH